MFYRVDDFDELTGPQFLSLALRVAAYQGVMQARLIEQSDHNKEVRQVDAEREIVNFDPALAGMVSWGDG